jgi:hypothetical protein
LSRNAKPGKAEDAEGGNPPFVGSILSRFPSNSPDIRMTNELLANIRVASPCSARWADMSGDERARFCAQCQKHVYNLSNLTTPQAVALIQSKEGKLCARFYRRADGTILTADCPIGDGRAWSRLKGFAAAAAAFVVAGLCVPLLAGTESRENAPCQRTKLHRIWDDARLKVKGWLGQPQRPAFVMGEIYVPPAKTNAPAGTNSVFR